MKNKTSKLENKFTEQKRLRGFSSAAAMGLTVLILSSLIWNIVDSNEHVKEIAKFEARAIFNKDFAIRSWASKHGGVYVPMNARTPANPYLAHIPYRNILHPNGDTLTLMNPAYMLRQMMNEFPKEYGAVGHITSLKPLNKNNAPDEWEKKALAAFEKGNKEVLEFAKLNGKDYLRLMQPLVTTESCLKCHAFQGYKVGDIRGGVGVSVPMEPLLVLAHNEKINLILWHSLLLLFGYGGIGFTFVRFSNKIKEHQVFETQLQEKEERLHIALQAVRDGVWDWEVQTGKTIFNERWAEIIGYTLDELSPMSIDTWTTYTHPDDVVKSNALLQKHFSGEMEMYECEARMKHKNGEWIWVFDRGKVIEWDTNGKPIRMTGTHVDITERKRAEETLRNERNLFIGGTTIVFKWQAKEGWPVEYVSANVEKQLGYSVNDFTSRKILFASIVHPEDLERVGNEVVNYSNAQAPFFEQEYRVLHANGEYRWLHDFTAVIRNNENTITHYHGYVQDITERKLAEEALRESEENLFITLNSIGDGVIATDEKGIVTRMNPVAEKLCGWPIADAREKPLTEVFKIINAQTRELVNNPVDIVIEKGFTVGLANHTILISKDGNEYQIADSAAPIKDKEGKIIGVILVFSDVTEEYNTKQILLENEKRYRTVFNNSPVGIVLLDETGIIYDTNKANAIITGYSIDELIGSDVRQLTEPENANLVDQNIKRILSGELLEHEVISCRKDGSRCVLFLRETSIVLPNRKPGILSISSDITGSKRVNDLLRESEEKYRFIAENTTDVITLLDLNLKYTYISPAVLSQRGYTVEEAMSQKLEEATTPETMKRVYQLFAEELANEASGTADPNRSRSLELEQYCKDGSTIWVDVSLSFIRDANGKATGIFAVSRDITERKKTNTLLNESETRLRVLINSTPDIICFKDRDGRWLIANESDLQLFCLQNVNYFGKTDAELAEITDPIYKNAFLSCMQSDELAWQSKAISISEEAIPTTSGTTMVYDVIKVPVFEADGSRKGLVVLGRDITEKKKIIEELVTAKEKAEKNERQYHDIYTLMRLMSDTMPDMLWAKNLNKEYIFVNEAICTGLLNAKDTEEPLGKTDMFFAMRERNSQPDNPEWHTFGEICGDSDAVTLEAMKPMQFDEFGNVKGKFLFLDVHKAPLYDNTGQLIGVVGSARDVTAAKAAENQLRKLSWAVEQSPASVVITDTEGTIEYVNPKFTEITGYTSEEAIGQNPRILKSGEQAPEVYTELWQTISAGKEWKGELHNKKKNGELYWESVLISPIKNEKGEILYFLEVKENITEKKKMIEELVIAKDKAEEMNRLKSNFLANMSHELRTPLNGILGYASILTSSLEDNEFAEMSETIYTSGKRLSETLNLILDLSKAETEKLEVVGKNLNIAPMIDSIVNSHKTDANKKGLLLETIIVTEDVCALLDENLFEQAISNLLKNAIKFTEKGKITVEVGKKLSEHNEWVYVKVIDTGIGIPEDKINLIWDEFRQVSEGMARNYEGTGLGLTISKRIIEMMKGKVTVESNVGVGSVFTVLLPSLDYSLNLNELSNQKLPSAEKSEKGKVEMLKPKVILYVEDDFINQNVVQLYLKEVCKVETARDGKTALQLAAGKEYDLFLMDINLGSGMDGMTVTKEIRKMPQYADAPIIAVTAYAMESDKKEFLAGGCSHYLSKPFDKKELLDVVTGIVKPKK